MILPIAVLFLQISAIAENSALTTVKAAAEVTPTTAEGIAKADGSSPHLSGPAGPAQALSTSGARASDGLVTLSDASSGRSPVGAVRLSAAASLSKAASSEKSHRSEWIALGIAQHSAAAFDAWSTRRALSTGNAQELNPLLRPFSGNSSIYVAIQVGPLLFDYVARRMMTSQYGWARHTWWILQAASTATSIASGAHNLTIH
jgi:hypothetical protein